MSTLTSSIATDGDSLPQMSNASGGSSGTAPSSGRSSGKAPSPRPSNKSAQTPISTSLDIGYGAEEGPATVHAAHSVHSDDSIVFEGEFERKFDEGPATVHAAHSVHNDDSIVEGEFERKFGSSPSVIEDPPNDTAEEDSSDDDLDAFDAATPDPKKSVRWGTTVSRGSTARLGRSGRWGLNAKTRRQSLNVSTRRRESQAFHCDVVNTLSSRRIRGSIVEETAGGEHGSFTWLPLLISLAMLFLGCLSLPAYFLSHEDDSLSIFKDSDVTIKFQYFATCLAIIPISIFMVWAIKQILPGGPGGETTEDGAGTSNAILRNSGILLLLCLALHQATNVVKETVREEFQSTLLRSLETGLGFSMFSFYVCIIDVFMNSVAGLADRLESIATSNPASSKMKGFMKNMARFRNPEKPILDKAYAIPGGTRSPARVLVEVAGVYGNLAKIAGFILLFLYMVGVDLYSTLVIVGVTALFASLLQALSINEAFSNLIPLALSNSVHIGEIVGIAGTGASPANKPDEALVGFVEAITWSHVVIRDFKRNQVFVPHHEMEKLTLYNWSRRPSKLIRFELAVVPSLSGGADRLATLSKFVLDWIAKHPKIDQQLYSKCALKIRSETAQPFLEIIFYPLVGEKARPIRAEFTVMIMDACKRLDICLVPAEVRMASAWPVEFSEVQDIATASARLQEEEDMGPDLSDLMPSEALTKRSGLPPSKKKKD